LLHSIDNTYMKSQFSILDAVALITPIPEHGLMAGQVGTIVEELEPNVFEVEFCDDSGVTYASLAIPAKSIMALHYSPAVA
jgi:hypothetical protein